jgi:hypothetical protein
MVLIDALPVTQQIEFAVLHDARIAHDTATINFTEYEKDGEQSWVVAIVTPDEDSGSATIQGGYINAESGDVVVPQDAESVVIKKGKWQKVITAAQNLRDAGEYSWSEPLEQEKRFLIPEDYYSPFAYGGTMIFMPTPDAEGIEQFGPVRMIFPDWVDYVQPAFKLYSQGENILFQSIKTKEELEKAKQYLESDNALIATTAFRELIRSQKIDAQTAATYLIKTAGRRRSVFAHIMLSNYDPEKNDNWAGIVGSVIQGMQKSAQIRNVALGAFAIALFQSDSQLVSEARAVLISARDKARQLGVTKEQDPKLFLMFEKMDIE